MHGWHAIFYMHAWAARVACARGTRVALAAWRGAAGSAHARGISTTRRGLGHAWMGRPLCSPCLLRWCLAGLLAAGGPGAAGDDAEICAGSAAVDLTGARIIAEAATQLVVAPGEKEPWYSMVYVTDCGEMAGMTGSAGMRCMSFGSPTAVPESIVQLRAVPGPAPTTIVQPTALHKLHMTVLSFGLTIHPAFAGLQDPAVPAQTNVDAAPLRGLVVGLAGGSIPQLWRHVLPARSQIDVVELDPAVVELARQHSGFDLEQAKNPSNVRTTVHIGDGLAFVMESKVAAYDLCVIDLDMEELKGGDETWRHLSRILGRDGVLMMNYWSPQPVASLLTVRIRNLLQLAKAHFATVYAFAVSQRNFVLIATDARIPIKRWQLASLLSKRWQLSCDISSAIDKIEARGGLLKMTQQDKLPRLAEINRFVESHGGDVARYGPLGPGALTKHYEAGGKPSRFYHQPAR